MTHLHCMSGLILKLQFKIGQIDLYTILITVTGTTIIKATSTMVIPRHKQCLQLQQHDVFKVKL